MALFLIHMWISKLSTCSAKQAMKWIIGTKTQWYPVVILPFSKSTKQSHSNKNFYSNSMMNKYKFATSMTMSPCTLIINNIAKCFFLYFTALVTMSGKLRKLPACIILIQRASVNKTCKTPEENLCMWLAHTVNYYQ